MLILVMIPVATAMDSEDAFYIEYDYPDEEIIVEEYDNFEEVDTQVDVSEQYHDEDFVEDQTQEYEDEIQNSHYEVEDAVEVPESIEDSDVVTHYDDIPEEDAEFNEVISNDLGNIVKYNNNSNEISHDDLTLDDVSVDVQGSFFISNDLTENYYNIIRELFNYETTTLEETTTSLNNINKVLELKDILLTNEKIQTYLNNQKIADLDCSLNDCINKITNDFAYSIDNSVVGDVNGIIIVITNPSFSNFDPCFDAAFSRNFLNVEYFFAGGFPLIAAGDFCEICFGDVFSGNLYVEYFAGDFLNVEYFFAGGFPLIAAGDFCEICFGDVFSGNLYVEYFAGDFLNVEYFFAGGYPLIAGDDLCKIGFVEYNKACNNYNVKFCPAIGGNDS